MYRPHQYWEARGRTYIYETHEGDEERGEWIKTFVREIKPESLLEVGVGPGKYLDRHIDVPMRAAIDFSSSAIRAIPDLFSCEVVIMDACIMGLRELAFDFSFTCAILVHVPYEKIGQAIDELCRVTRDNILVMEYWDPERIIGELAPHCFRHDYPREFGKRGFRVVRAIRLSALIGLFLFERLEGSVS